MATRRLTNIPFVEAHRQGDKQKPTAIVLTLSSTTSDKGAAFAIANRLHKSNAPLNSYHYLVDEAETYQGVQDDAAAYSSLYRAIDILVCAEPVEDARAWSMTPHINVLHRTADLVAQLAQTYKIPVRYLDHEAEERWMKHKSRRRGGIIVEIPGEWASELFLIIVETQMRKEYRS